MSGLYQNLEVSWTNFTFILTSGYPSVGTKETGTFLTAGQGPSGDRRWALRLTINGLWDVCGGVCAGQVWCAAAAACHQVLVVHPLYISSGHVSLFWELRGHREGWSRRLGSDVVRGAASSHRRPAARQGAGGHASSGHFGVPANQRTGGDIVPVGASCGLVSDQGGARLTQASLEGRARRRVGGHGTVEGVGTAGNRVDSHDVDLGALGGGGAVWVGGGGAVST